MEVSVKHFQRLVGSRGNAHCRCPHHLAVGLFPLWLAKCKSSIIAHVSRNRIKSFVQTFAKVCGIQRQSLWSHSAECEIPILFPKIRRGDKTIRGIVLPWGTLLRGSPRRQVAGAESARIKRSFAVQNREVCDPTISRKRIRNLLPMCINIAEYLNINKKTENTR